MTEDWKKGHAAGHAAEGMVVQMCPPEGADAREWMSGFMAGRRKRDDDQIMERFDLSRPLSR